MPSTSLRAGVLVYGTPYWSRAALVVADTLTGRLIVRGRKESR
jgi:hypothetical protein